MMDQALQDRARSLTTELAALALVCEKWGWDGFSGLMVAYCLYYVSLLGIRPGYVVVNRIRPGRLAVVRRDTLVDYEGPTHPFAGAHLRRLWVLTGAHARRLWKRWRS